MHPPRQSFLFLFLGHNFVLHMAAAVRRKKQVACGREPLPLLCTRRRAGPQRAAGHPRRAWPVPARDRLQVRPHRGDEGRCFPETAPAECVDATRSDASAAQGAGGANADVLQGFYSQLEFCGGTSLGAQNRVCPHNVCQQ